MHKAPAAKEGVEGLQTHPYLLTFVHTASLQWRGRVQHKEAVSTNPQLPSDPCSEGSRICELSYAL